MSKFYKLEQKLRNNKEESLKISFDELNSLVEGGLPESAYKHRAYFANTTTHSIANVWLDAGYYVSEVNKYENYVIFVKKEFYKECIVSPSILEKMVKSNKYPVYKLLISPITYAWSVFNLKLTEKEIFNYCNGKNACFVSLKCNEVSFENFREEASDVMDYIITNINLFYKGYISTVFNLMLREKTSMNELMEWFNGIDNLFYQDREFTDYTIKRIINNFLCNFSLNDVDFINYIYKNDIKELKEYFVFNTPFLYSNYYHFIGKLFLNNCKKGNIYFDPELIVDLLNIDHVSHKDNTLYLTEKTIHSEILIGTISNRVLTEYYFLKKENDN